MKQFLVLSNDTDVAIYTLAYFHAFKTTTVRKIWVKFVIHERQRHIPVYQLAEILGTERLRALLKAHILIGCDVTRKKLDPNQQPAKHARKNICMTLEKMADDRKVPR